MKVMQSVGTLASSFSDPPPMDKKIEFDLELNDQPKVIQDRYYKVRQYLETRAERCGLSTASSRR